MTARDPQRDDAPDRDREQPGLVGWLRAMSDGLLDTLREARDAGRAGAEETSRRYWHRFDEKTKTRRPRK